MLSHDLNVKDFKLPVDGKSGTGGLWMTYVVPPVLLNQGYSPPCKFGYTIYLMLTKLYPPVSLIPKSIFIQGSILGEHIIVNFHLLWFQNYF